MNKSQTPISNTSIPSNQNSPASNSPALQTDPLIQSWIWKDPPAHQRSDYQIYFFFSQNLKNPQLTFSRSQIKQLILTGDITVNGQTIKPSSSLKPHSTITLRLPQPPPFPLQPEPAPFTLLFEDQHLLVVDKPAGLTVHPCSTQQHATLVQALLHQNHTLSSLGGSLRPGIVHRLDKNTSGVLIVAKTDAAYLKLIDQFAQHLVKRTYWAVCYGSPFAPPHPSRRIIDQPIGRHPYHRTLFSTQVKRGKKAISHLKKLKEFGLNPASPFAAWSEVTLQTGRTHQIRVHFNSIGHSLLGDPTYGNPRPTQSKWSRLPALVQEAVHALPGQALHAIHLEFHHPMTQCPLFFQAQCPPAFQNLLNALESFTLF